MAKHVEKATIQEDIPLYPPSWIDHLIQWIGQLPIPAWLFYMLCMLVLAVLINVVLWIDGSVPYGSYGSIPGIFPPFVFYFLALYHYLTWTGSRSLQNYRPLLNTNEAEIARIDYELGMLPRWLGWLAIVIGLATTPPYFLEDRIAFGNLSPKTVLPNIVAVVAAAFFAATFMLLLIRSIRQLRMVRSLHAQATNINLLKLKPAHAFSALTAQTGIGVILILVLGSFYNPTQIGYTWIIFWYFVIALIAALIFVVPIIGLRGLLEKEKERVLSETSDLLQATTENLHTKVKNKDYDDIGGMQTAISTLIRERELLEKISTWPWDTGTLRGFASSLLLPIFLWLVTRFLDRFF